MKTYIWAIDAGHEWLAVKKQELTDLNIADKITEFSYIKGETVYLEGDCDAATFIEAYRNKNGVEPKTKQGKHWDRQPCRGFARYAAPKTATHIPQGENLANYVEQRNRWMAIFNSNEGITFPLTQAGVDKIISQLDADLSPENLHCDGEITAAQAQAKYRFYKAVADELADYTYANGLQMRELDEL